MFATRDQGRGTIYFQIPYYYDSQVRFQSLYRDSWGSLIAFFYYLDQGCLALFLKEVVAFRQWALCFSYHILLSDNRPCVAPITSFFQSTLSSWSVKCDANIGQTITNWPDNTTSFKLPHNQLVILVPVLVVDKLLLLSILNIIFVDKNKSLGFVNLG